MSRTAKATTSRTASTTTPGLHVADIVRVHLDEYLAARGGRMPVHLQRVLRQLTACRTPVLGGSLFQCSDCGATELRYHSCRNRHCPQCGGTARARWLERVSQQLLPVPYYQVVFTLPDELSDLTLAHPAKVYQLLFRAAADTLLEVAADPQYLGAELGFWLVLHTWGQQLQHHPHVHAVVPGGGLSPSGSRWVNCPASFLLPVRVLSQVFRDKFLAGLRRLWTDGELRGPASPAAAEPCPAWLDQLAARDWVVWCQPPPPGLESRPEAVLAYLARYVSGTAISERRLIAFANGAVTFQWKDYRTGRSDNLLTLPGVEFVRRFVQHILPRGFPRVRSYGLLANRPRAAALTRCRELLGVPDQLPSPAAISATESPRSDGASSPSDEKSPTSDDESSPTWLCPACGSRAWHEIARTLRPPWWQVPPLSGRARSPPPLRSPAS